MASEDGQTSHRVTLHRRLQAAPHQFDFKQALRLLECAHRELPRLGESSLPRDDPVRLSQEPSLAFAPATLVDFQPPTTETPPRLTVSFFGLFGPNGPLPLHLTDYARSRIRNAKDSTFARFADIFHHRMLCLLYRTWAEAQPAVSHDRPETDRFSERLGALFGIGVAELRERDAMPDRVKLYFAGRLAGQTKHREGLRAILREFFQVPVDIEQFVGHWMSLPTNARWRVGADRVSGALGQGTVAGARVWDRQYKFRIMMGPLSLNEYQRFLPGGKSLGRLVAIVRNYVGDELAWDVQLILKRDETPAFRLGDATRLGWNTWSRSGDCDEDADDLCLNPLRQGELGHR